MTTSIDAIAALRAIAEFPVTGMNMDAANMRAIALRAIAADPAFQGRPERHSDQSVLVIFPSSRLASKFEVLLKAGPWEPETAAVTVPDDREAFELAYATEWHKSRSGDESVEQLAAVVKGWREGDTYGDGLPRLRFGWKGYQWALAAPGALEAVAGLGKDTLYLLRRLLSNQHTLTGSEFRAELARIVEDAHTAAAPVVLPEPIATVTRSHDFGGEVDWTGRATAPVGAKLYMEPQAQADARGAVWLQAADMAALERFEETTSDNQGYDIGRVAVARLAGFGCLQSHGFGVYSITDFGHFVLNDWEHARTLPFCAQAERDAHQRAATTVAKGEQL